MIHIENAWEKQGEYLQGTLPSDCAGVLAWCPRWFRCRWPDWGCTRRTQRTDALNLLCLFNRGSSVDDNGAGRGTLKVFQNTHNILCCHGAFLSTKFNCNTVYTVTLLIGNLGKQWPLHLKSQPFLYRILGMHCPICRGSDACVHLDFRLFRPPGWMAVFQWKIPACPQAVMREMSGSIQPARVCGKQLPEFTLSARH